MSWITRSTFINAARNFIKDKLIKAALKSVLGSVYAGGFKAWIIKLIVVEFTEEVAVPLVQFATRKGLLFYDKTTGAIKIKKIEQAKEDGNEDDYTSNIGNV